MIPCRKLSKLTGTPLDGKSSCISHARYKIVAVHIRFIAVDNNLHHHKLGTNILRIVIESIKKLSKEWPIRVVTIDAREELIGWYEQESFKKMKNNTPGQDGVSEAMYFSLLNYSDELEEYCSEY